MDFAFDVFSGNAHCSSSDTCGAPQKMGLLSNRLSRDFPQSGCTMREQALLHLHKQGGNILFRYKHCSNGGIFWLILDDVFLHIDTRTGSEWLAVGNAIVLCNERRQIFVNFDVILSKVE